ncbi:PHB depolymerase family esterase [Psychrosphaera sp. B3R10]|uniref:extracellular catalytic domain type 1 short-chain-length polyhydroxyalkanoate depolymerase n=1 Tax=unclassified Psychrosphaera TaxID=2641570 RepID=UPI001C0975A9|nr:MULTISPECIES: PHB depolymerase family esterase [unclassified Psychrosphaera]MBU2882845.1 PHB depolymerase family esterase [Psychrosphaera sp. I2R16]MBU2990416.1 PHB depolymerase family esterase [Psychrosphaera sp. B3R10]
MIIINRIYGFFLLVSLFFATSVNAGSWQQNVSIGGFNNVHIYTPDSSSAIGVGKSLLIVLHGCVQPINNYLTAQLEDAAEQHGMVVAVPDAMNKAGYSCWSYWQGTKNRTSGDYKNLINLANAMSGDASRNIDANQVYLAGLSSGGAFTQQAGCVAPDVFAGVAPSAGPTLGTSSNGALNNCEVVTPTTFKSRCESYAGSYSAHLDTQIAVVGHGTADTTVDTCYNQQNANGYANVYGVSQLSGSTTISDGTGHTASETLWTGNRVAMVWFDGLDHSWSGGAGASGDYIASNSINFASYLGQYFSDNNQRVDRNSGPVITVLNAVDNNNVLAISGNAIDDDSSVTNVEIVITDVSTTTPTAVATINTTAATNNGYFSADSTTLNDGLYLIEVRATDDLAKTGDTVSITTRVGPEPPATAPQMSDVTVAVSGQCATISGSVLDQNQNLSSVEASFTNGVKVATVNSNQFNVEQCGLSGGTQTANVTATDSTSLSSTVQVSFTIDAGKTGDYNYHIAEGHITWGYGYSACYLEFGTNDFTMREYQAGSTQCNWVADGAPSCKGQNQACSAQTGPIDSDNDGIDDNLDNCPNMTNSDQADNDNDGLGNVCDATPNGGSTDSDSDGIADSLDNCPNMANSDQADNDSDGLGNVCDATPNGDYSCTEYTSSNYSHVMAGRAVNYYGYAIAVGSGDNLGYYNIYVTSTVAEISNGHFEKGSCSSY